MTSLAKMKETAEENLDNSSKFASINKCSDEYTYVDMFELKEGIDENLAKVTTMFNICIACFAFMAVECCCGCSCFVIASTSNGRAGNCNFPDGPKFFRELQYYLCELIKVGS